MANKSMGTNFKQMERKIDICLSPELIEFHSQSSIVVLNDIIRATTSITTALANGVEHIVALETIKEAIAFKPKGYLLAGERKTKRIEGFDFGNNPLEFNKLFPKNTKIAFTTTNGTYSLKKIEVFDHLLIGAFVNISAICQKILNTDGDVLIVCSGRLRNIAIEDTLFAGMLADKLLKYNRFYLVNDSSKLAHSLYLQSKNDLLKSLLKLSPQVNQNYLRLKQDIDFAFEIDKFNIVPYFDKINNWISG